MGSVGRLHRVILYSGLLALCGLSIAVTRASADDSAIAFGGNPGMLHGHPSVSMASEIVKIYVYDKRVRVDCDFTFTNHGPACHVRMGFPDVGIGSYETHEGDAEAEGKMNERNLTTFYSFRSYVDGKPVSTKFIRSNEIGHYWHTKTVFFPTHSTRHIRDVYTHEVGIAEASLRNNPDYNKNKAVWVNQVGYILHTGASWHGSIGRAEIDVSFRCKAIPSVLKLIPSNWKAVEDDGYSLKVDSVARNTVIWKGPCAPTVRGRNMRFVCSHLHPTTRDDITLTYNYSKEP